jgi:peptide/nickel transport system permease protein
VVRREILGIPLARFILKRLAFTLPVLWGVTVVVFLLVRILPGDIANYILGSGADPAEVQALREELGLDRPWHEQYAVWIGNTATGNLGYSNQYRRPVEDVIYPKLRNTLILTFGAFVLSSVIGIGVGIVAGTRPNTMLDRCLTTISIGSASVPGYWLGLMLMFLFALKLGWLPATGMYDARDPGGIRDLLRHMILPAITVAAVPTAVISRLVRSAMIEVMHYDYIRTARAKGLLERMVILRHALPNAAPTTISIVTLQLGFLLGGSIFAEIIFAWPGMGSQLYSSIGARDAAVIQTITLMTALIFISANFLADVSHSILDPRVRLG